MEVGDRVVIETEGNLKWADGKTGTVKTIVHLRPKDPDILTITVDGMDTKKPPFGIVTVYDVEVRKIDAEAEPMDISGTDDPVNHPSHYTDGKYECIDYIESQQYDEDGYLFNAVKYISRAGKKDPDKYEEDIQKAIWYLKRRKERWQVIKKSISTKDYILDKGLENTLPGIALELIEKREFDMAAKVLQMELDTHKEHSS